jgi:hypothetical protein
MSGVVKLKLLIMYVKMKYLSLVRKSMYKSTLMIYIYIYIKMVWHMPRIMSVDPEVDHEDTITCRTSI